MKTLPLMIDQSTGLQAHALRRIIVMLFKLLFNPERCSLCRLVSLLNVTTYKEQYTLVD